MGNQFLISPDNENGLKSSRITKREMEVLDLLSRGLTSKEIAERIFLSKRTVEAHRKKLLNKTNSKNCLALIRYAFVSGLLKDN